MKDFLLQHDGRYIECEVDNLKLTYTCSDDPKSHYTLTLRNHSAYNALKREIDGLYASFSDTTDGYWAVCEFLQSSERDKFFTDDLCYCYSDIRDRDEIISYENEAYEKVWLMRSRPVDDPEIERRRQEGVERILDTYDDIPKDGYTDWDCGYWNGIMGALRWVMGDEKDFLDT